MLNVLNWETDTWREEQHTGERGREEKRPAPKQLVFVLRVNNVLLARLLNLSSALDEP
jgi:hypothetical protein